MEWPRWRMTWVDKCDSTQCENSTAMLNERHRQFDKMNYIIINATVIALAQVRSRWNHVDDCDTQALEEAKVTQSKWSCRFGEHNDEDRFVSYLSCNRRYTIGCCHQNKQGQSSKSNKGTQFRNAFVASGRYGALPGSLSSFLPLLPPLLSYSMNQPSSRWRL